MARCRPASYGQRMSRIPVSWLIAGCLVGLGAAPSGATAAAPRVCVSVPHSFGLRASQVDCIDARQVQRVYMDEFCGQGCRYRAAGRTWWCTFKILRSYGYDPAAFGDQVLGRVLCVHTGNRSRFVKWQYHGGGD
jgi:hypothetical protein